MRDTAGVPLRRLLIAVGEPLVDVLAAPRGFDVGIGEVLILDPEEDAGGAEDALVLVIGARGRAAQRLVRSAAADGAGAVAVKAATDADARALRDAATDAGVALLGVRPQVRWERLASFARCALDDARAGGAEAAEALDDLFALAQTLADTTGGIVSIEDTTSRVLAYSRSDEQVDELRRLSILGRRGPESYLAMLREWGVYERLRRGEEVVPVEERPDLGVRRRLAIGIHAGSRPLGTIWVQQASEPLAEGAERALLGAARVAALQLIRQRSEATAGPRFRENLLAGLLEGRIDADSVAGNIGAEPGRPAAVVVFAPGGQEPGSERTELELQRTELAGLIAVHASAYRRSALVTTIGSRVYALLPDLPAGEPESAVLGLAREVASAAERSRGARVRAGVGAVVPALHAVPESRAEADRVLDVLGHGAGAGDIATLADVRAQVLVGEVLDRMAADERFRDVRVQRLREHDAEHGSDLARSLLVYLESFGDVRTAAARLHVHPNTLRHRMRRAAELADIGLADPVERLNAHLQLLLAHRPRRG
ncbi:helix-turn-helix domain-containing protein [Saccharopolyspora sp. HNM0983]|uniref:Helix-turn-helix domain-containing protein n=1 Tax=Saccharopolyspora montiporae TaxID=2781240 RepID=A0A929B960_9PSEU|nr:helix-turn-helix domain-containing protein [Saccharopolyspora sp. HNM0983]MBE9373347.1 helix-turn-helix domain-containing protein [Saccharopolyspora sp. HNM0983]